MKAFLRALLMLGGLALVGAVAGVLVMAGRGFSTREQPSALEALLARTMRRLATPAAVRAARNPVVPTPEVLARARAHFADHCASCHGNDGRGQTKLGQNLYPKAPDMTAAATQSLTDGELFSIIENGIRLTGMAAFGSPEPDDDAETWELVHLIRHLPQLTPEEIAEMEELNPRSRAQLEEEDAIRRFLAGEGEGPTAGSEAKAKDHH
jgi:mono/diheme cytochrome c family protein